ncbi:geranylgeranyl transferase type-1 subunit beta [Colletes latitarsis]|uniref:geranylgeranyl transferase type-1 subunit beta n=1 Tax=Colletes latitarsis TaxID=2605962 RepID=UPI0040362E86
MSEYIAPVKFSKRDHANYLIKLLQTLPSDLSDYDSSRLTIAFFAISGLDLLNCLDYLSEQTQFEAVEWIYRLQVTGAGPRSGFQPSTAIPKDAPEFQCGHLTMTYVALATLLTLKDNLVRVDKRSIIEGVKACQNLDGSFKAIVTGSESDMRFLYCACCISMILNDWSGVDKAKAIDYILKSISYDGAIGQGPGLESHGGSTFCAVASLFLMNELHILTNDQLNRLRRWCIMRQDLGFHGRPGKPSDSCYSFWVGATLKMLDAYKFSDREDNRTFLFNCQCDRYGGFAKNVHCEVDPLHTYLCLCSLSLLKETDLCTLHPALNISDRAYAHLLLK